MTADTAGETSTQAHTDDARSLPGSTAHIDPNVPGDTCADVDAHVPALVLAAEAGNIAQALPAVATTGLPVKRLLPPDDSIPGSDFTAGCDGAGDKIDTGDKGPKAPRLDLDLVEVPSSTNHNAISLNAGPTTNRPHQSPVSSSGLSAPFSFTREIGDDMTMARVDSKFYDPPPLLLLASHDSDHQTADAASVLDSVAEDSLEEVPISVSPDSAVPGLVREKLRFSVLAGLSSEPFSPVLLPVVEETQSPSSSPAPAKPLQIRAGHVPGTANPRDSSGFADLDLPPAVAEFLSPAARALVSTRLRPLLNAVAVQHDALARTRPILTACLKWSAICAVTPAIFFIAVIAAVFCSPGLFIAGVAWVAMVVAYRGVDAATTNMVQMVDTFTRRIANFTGDFSESFVVASENAGGVLKMFLTLDHGDVTDPQIAADTCAGGHNQNTSIPSKCHGTEAAQSDATGIKL
ncbi:hypothetical protein HDU82_000331 [Entophlyctis luteolus]|nr:hypothetical protein HDU82_000331 [Entophlyctis luteolus]